MIGTTTFATHKGARPYQEDRSLIAKVQGGTILAVADGHGGQEVSDLLLGDNGLVEAWGQNWDPKKTIEQVIKDTFQVLEVASRGLHSGSTLSLVFLPAKEDAAYVAVVGDSPVLIQTGDVLYIGPDHNVRTNMIEADKAQRRGGFISGGYLCRGLSSGGLQMARAMGDDFLGNVLDRTPEIQKVPLNKKSWILVGTDGLFDPAHTGTTGLNPQSIAKQIKAGATVNELVHQAVSLPTGDNVTAILWELKAKKHVPVKSRKAKAANRTAQ